MSSADGGVGSDLFDEFQSIVLPSDLAFGLGCTHTHTHTHTHHTTYTDGRTDGHTAHGGSAGGGWGHHVTRMGAVMVACLWRQDLCAITDVTKSVVGLRANMDCGWVESKYGLRLSVDIDDNTNSKSRSK